MLRRVLQVLVFCAAAVCAAVPTPKEHFGYEPGADYKLANYDEIIGYFRALANSSDRIQLVEYGKTSFGRTSYVAFISSAENLKQLERYRDINRRLALGIASAAEAKELAREGKAIVWIDSGLHATEVAPAQHSAKLAYKMIADDSQEVQRIRENVILMQVPVINPDGLDMVVEWQRKNVGTPFELAPLPRLYQKYAGHDNNRDWFMLNLVETRNVTKLLFQEWFPHIVYNQHQAPAFPARIFVPPYAEPLNPNIPAPVMEGINMIGAAMKERFAREDKPGVLSYFGFDAWWNGGLRSVPAFHNMHGILTETALNGYATPRTYKVTEFPQRFSNGISTKEPSMFYQRPWLGGRWGTAEAIEYMLTADFAILDLAATRPDHFLYKAWQMARDNIEAGKRGKPYAYVVPPDQWDRSSAVEMLTRLQMGGIEVRRAAASFRAGGTEYPQDTWVLLAGQPFRAYLVDLMEPQKYPELRMGSDGPTKRPYDITGWTLPMQMGVKVTRIDEPFTADLSVVDIETDVEPSFDRRDNSSFLAISAALAQNQPVRWGHDGLFVRPGDRGFEEAGWELKVPRVGVYEPWAANIDTGWTEWVLDKYKVPYTVLRSAEFAAASLEERFDAIILASQSMRSILHGYREGESNGRSPTDANTLQRPEFTGGIGVKGAAALREFVRSGGTLIAFDEATELPVTLFPLPLRTVTRRTGRDSDYYSPGSILRIKVETKHPVAFGMPADAFAFQSGGQAWETALVPGYVTDTFSVHTIATYAAKDLLASGWVSGERAVLGKMIAAEVKFGDGRVILFGFNPQFRGQSFGTFKLLLNAVYWASATEL